MIAEPPFPVRVKGRLGFCRFMLAAIWFGGYSAGEAGKNHEQLDQCEALAEARSHASRTQERIRSPKSAMNA